MLFIAATMSVLAAQRFGEEFGVWDRVGTCPIPTSAYIPHHQLVTHFFPLMALVENRPSPRKDTVARDEGSIPFTRSTLSFIRKSQYFLLEQSKVRIKVRIETRRFCDALDVHGDV
jgi:hypothetical protein